MPTTEYGQRAIALCHELLTRPSITPDDAGCQQLMIERLAAIGFHSETMGAGGVTNFWATRGDAGPTLVFAGHTDVVPTGPLEAWDSPPFEPSVRDGKLFARGAADMKASLAAMVVATEAFVDAHPEHRGRIGFLITSDEEGPATDGTVHVVRELQARGETIDWCIVGEPSSRNSLGDTIKNGRRGSINAQLTVHGTQGHVAYPHLADNPIHRALKALDAIANLEWDQGNAWFDPSSLQFTNLGSGTGASNVIPGTLSATFNVRFSPETSEVEIRRRCEAVLQAQQLTFDIEWTLSGHPFITEPGTLVSAVSDSIVEVVGSPPELSTSGGTSDGRFIAPMLQCQLVELGPVNASIHQINEHVLLDDIPRLTKIYHGVLTRLLLP